MINIKIMKKIFVFSVLFIGLFLFFSCSTPRKTGFELQREIYENEEEDTNYKKLEPDSKIYITGTKPIDSVDVNKLIFDIFRVEPLDYPNEVRCFARVYDSTGNFVTNMADPYRKDESIRYFTSVREQLGKNYNIRNTPIDSFTVREYGAGDSIAYSIVLTVDYSGSMDAVAPAIFEGTELFIKLKFDQDRIALATFNKDFDLKVPITSDSSQLLSLYRLRRKNGFGMFSAVFDAVWKSMDILKDEPKDNPKVLVLFTDGDENYSKKNVDSVIKFANLHDIHIFCVAFGYAKDDAMRAMADYTGGRFYRAQSKEQLVSVFRDIYLSLRFSYKISYRPPKYWGYHHLYAGLNVPGRADSLIADGYYDTSGWLSLSDTVIRPILFDFDKADIKPESYPVLDELIDLMFTWPKLKFDIQGHTDNIGGVDYNQSLSERRAKAVYDALIKGGVDEKRLRWRGFGMSKPLQSNTTEQGRSINRRTEFLIIAK